MIVDLIRHDLHGVVGSGKVRVPKLMVVEEYATVFQLVSVIEGRMDGLSDSDNDDEDDGAGCDNGHLSDLRSPMDVLAASLPPGSMTGAPKLRSCQLLQTIEDRPRGIYSGVVGYMDVGGGGDWSVVIRSAVRWDGDGEECDVEGAGAGGSEREEDGKGDTWTIGAGGAVTALSTEEGEWEEMMAKLKSTLRLF